MVLSHHFRQASKDVYVLSVSCHILQVAALRQQVDEQRCLLALHQSGSPTTRGGLVTPAKKLYFLCRLELARYRTELEEAQQALTGNVNNHVTVDGTCLLCHSGTTVYGVQNGLSQLQKRQRTRYVMTLLQSTSCMHY